MNTKKLEEDEKGANGVNNVEKVAVTNLLWAR